MEANSTKSWILHNSDELKKTCLVQSGLLFLVNQMKAEMSHEFQSVRVWCKFEMSKKLQVKCWDSG